MNIKRAFKNQLRLINMVETEQTMAAAPFDSFNYPLDVERGIALDIQELDNGLLHLLLPNVQSMFQYMRCSETNTKVINSAAVHILKAIMIYSTNFYSPAMRHLNVKVAEKRVMSKRRGERHTQFPKIYSYILITCLLPLLHELIKYKATIIEEDLRQDTTVENTSTSTSAMQRQLARSRQAKILQVLLGVTSIVMPPIQLYNHLRYILKPKEWQTPSFAMNDNGLSYQYEKSNGGGEVERKINFLYAQRRIWYEEFMLTIGLLPIDVWRNLPEAIKLSYRRMLVQLKAILPKKIRKKFISDHGSSDAIHSCAICSLKPIVIPYKTSCCHVYCYTCLRSALVDNSQYRCMICGAKVAFSKPL